MANAAERGRPMRRCARCGRTGYNAFERTIDPAGSDPEWVCTHREPCLARRLERWRAGTRTALGRAPSSPITPWADEDQKACVVAVDPDATERLEQLVRDLTPLQVEQLDGSPRAMARLSRGDYCLIVVDAGAGDPLAFCNELYRRLSRGRLSRVPLIIVREPGQRLRGPLAKLAGRPQAECLTRPMTPPAFMAGISTTLGWAGFDDVQSA